MQFDSKQASRVQLSGGISQAASPAKAKSNRDQMAFLLQLQHKALNTGLSCEHRLCFCQSKACATSLTLSFLGKLL